MSIILDCSGCVGAETERCDDCVVRFVVECDEGVDAEEVRAIRVMAEAGLLCDVRPLRAAG